MDKRHVAGAGSVCQDKQGNGMAHSAHVSFMNNQLQAGEIINHQVTATPSTVRTTDDQVSMANSNHLRDMHHEYKGLQTIYTKLTTLAKEAKRPHILANGISTIGLKIHELGRLLQDDDACQLADRMEGSISAPNNQNISGLYTISVECALGLCDDHERSTLPEAELSQIQVRPDAIGAICDKYVTASKLKGDQSDEFPNSGKKKVCNNADCATRRHGSVVRTTAIRVVQWAKKATEDMLAETWFQHDGPPVMILNGFEIRGLTIPGMLSVKMADALMRMMRSREVTAMSKWPMLPGRHYVSPSWAMNITNGDCCTATSLDMFLSPPPPYDVKRCSIVLMLVRFGEAWSCYAFDVSKKTVSIMDPNIKQPIPQKTMDTHRNTCAKLLPHLLYCVRTIRSDETTGRGTWTPRLLLSGRKCALVQNSGIQAINCMRWYNGDSVCVPPSLEGAPETRRDLAYLLLAMQSNTARVRVINEAKDEVLESNSRKKARKDPHEEGSATNATSSGSSDHLCDA